MKSIVAHWQFDSKMLLSNTLGMRMVLWIAYCSKGPYVSEHAAPSGDHMLPSGANTDSKGVKMSLLFLCLKRRYT